jgi:recombination protein RecT
MSTPARRDDRAPATVTQQDGIKAILSQYRPVIGKLLARTDTPEETFVAQIGNALRSTPQLWACAPETVLGAALRCAQLDLPPNDGRNLAWIIPYRQNATFQLGYGGVIELARRAAPGLRIDGRPVYPNDIFDLDYGRQPPLKHKPAASRRPPKDRGGDADAWYVRVTFPDGAEQVHLLDRAGVDYHRSFSQQPNGDMWTKSYDAAALKSVVLDMRRWLPSSPQFATAVAADDKVHDVRDMQEAGQIVHRPDQDAPPAIDTGASGPPAAAEGDEDDEWVREAQGAPT